MEKRRPQIPGALCLTVSCAGTLPSVAGAARRKEERKGKTELHFQILIALRVTVFFS